MAWRNKVATSGAAHVLPELSREPQPASGTQGRLVINPIVYAEVSAGFDRIEDLDEAVPAADFEREHLPYQAAFVAGKAVKTGMAPITLRDASVLCGGSSPLRPANDHQAS
jgi:hypothetical protein